VGMAARIPIGTLAVNGFRRIAFTFTGVTPNNDLGPVYILAHPRRQTVLVCDFHGKSLKVPVGGGAPVYHYEVDVRNRAANPTDVVNPTDVDVDFSFLP
jgi:hypothetical protein